MDFYMVSGDSMDYRHPSMCSLLSVHAAAWSPVAVRSQTSPWLSDAALAMNSLGISSNQGHQHGTQLNYHHHGSWQQLKPRTSTWHLVTAWTTDFNMASGTRHRPETSTQTPATLGSRTST